MGVLSISELKLLLELGDVVIWELGQWFRWLCKSVSSGGRGEEENIEEKERKKIFLVLYTSHFGLE